MKALAAHLVVLLLILGLESKANSQAPKPNILLIVSDDQGYNDLGTLGNGIITPYLDRLAKEGTRLTNFYVAWPACTPSRGAFLTGRYPQRNGIYDMIRNEAPDYGYKYSSAEYEVSFERIGGMDLKERLLPEYLRTAGYQNGIFGKWDLGSLKRYLPTRRGFDVFYGFVNTGIDYFTHERYGVPSMFQNLQPTEEDKGTYCTYLFEREALKFLANRNQSNPFFLYLPFNAPHNSSALNPKIRSSVQAPTKFKAQYPKVTPEVRIVENHRYESPATLTTKEARKRDYRAAVTCMDQSIGNIFNALETQGVLDETLIIFFSDNGGSGGADNSPLRGHKSQTWEGGVRVPCLIRWPKGGVPAGEVSAAFLSSLELLPSLAKVSGVHLSDDVILDGFDWWPTILDNAPSPRKELFWKRRDRLAARVGDWKWVDMEGTEGGLFNLKEDIAEKNDLSESHPQQLTEITARYQAWLQRMNSADPRGPFKDF